MRIQYLMENKLVFFFNYTKYVNIDEKIVKRICRNINNINYDSSHSLYS